MYSLAATVTSGQLLSAVSFLQRHPDAAAAVFTLSLASTVIQVGETLVVVVCPVCLRRHVRCTCGCVDTDTIQRYYSLVSTP
jgi:hypothetical protein